MRFATRVILFALVAMICAISQPVAAGQQVAAGLQVDKNSVRGVVVNAKGGKPEAGYG
jgi:hypothetical protein